MDKMGYSISEAAEALGIGVSLMKEELYNGRVFYTKIGKRVVIPHWALEEQLARPETPAEVRPELAVVQVHGTWLNGDGLNGDRH